MVSILNRSSLLSHIFNACVELENFVNFGSEHEKTTTTTTLTSNRLSGDEVDKVLLGFRNDKRFFLKTQSRREVRFLLSNLQAYMGHLEKYPHSLMVRFLGKSSFC